MRTSPFSPRPSRSTKPKETLDVQDQLERGESFGYNALKIPTFTPAPAPQIQAKSEPGELTDTTAISGEVEPNLDREEDQNEEEKSETENQAITEGENFGYNALKIPTFTPAQPIQPKSEPGELTDTTAISGEVEPNLSTEKDQNEEEKSQTETQSITEGENFGYNAWNIPTFTPAPQIQAKSEPGALTDAT